MSEHKFVVGQSGQFSPDWLIDKTTERQYTVIRLFPKDGNVPQYRIKSERDGHERMVLEDRLDGLAKLATAKLHFADVQRQALRIAKIDVSDQ